MNDAFNDMAFFPRNEKVHLIPFEHGFSFLAESLEGLEHIRVPSNSHGSCVREPIPPFVIASLRRGEQGTLRHTRVNNHGRNHEL